ncbi:hypothetical protein LZ023_15300 [Pseudomonas silvicola]|nr:hypothetical protein LZ023_15300 [Pseudomonas silvicola]
MDKKEIRITIRLSAADLTKLESRMAEAGYHTAGAFIRDFVAKGKLKPKVNANTVTVARELDMLAMMIRKGAPISELLATIRTIALVNAGGVQ